MKAEHFRNFQNHKRLEFGHQDAHGDTDVVCLLWFYILATSQDGHQFMIVALIAIL